MNLVCHRALWEWKCPKRFEGDRRETRRVRGSIAKMVRETSDILAGTTVRGDHPEDSEVLPADIAEEALLDEADHTEETSEAVGKDLARAVARESMK